MNRKTPRDKNVLISELEKLTHEKGYIYALSYIVATDVYLDPAEAADIDWYSRLSFQELSLLSGLLVKQKIDLTFPSIEQFDEHVKRTKDLCQELHFAFNKPVIEKMVETFQRHAEGEEIDESHYIEVFGDGKSMMEAIFYSESGAYDFQYFNYVKERFAEDNPWLLKKYGFDADHLSSFARELKQLSQEKHNAMKGVLPSSFDEMLQGILDSNCVTTTEVQERLPGIESSSLIKAFSCKPATVNPEFTTPGEYNKVDSHPLIQLSDNKYFLPVTFLLSQSIYESPFYWMMDDESYKDLAAAHRGNASENIAESMLMNVFGKNSVFKGVQVIRKKGQAKTDIDILAVLGNKALIIQSKSKRLTTLSRSGNTQQLKSDFNKAIQEAYEQASKSREALLAGVKLMKSDGKELILPTKIDEAYIVCLTSDFYPAVMHQTDIYLEREETNVPPVAISIFDLDVLCFYLQDPYDLLYYLRQRVALNDYCIGSSEVSLLAFHLNKKLVKTPSKRRHKIGIDQSLAQLIDANFPAMKGEAPVTEAIDRLHHGWKNESFDSLIADIKKSAPEFTDAVFMLYDLAGAGADDLVQQIGNIKEKSRRDGKSHDASLIYENGRMGITLVCEQNDSMILDNKLLALSQARKYKTKADIWLGIGLYESSDRLVDTVVFNNTPWEKDEKLEYISRILLKQGQEIFSKKTKTGRNENCPCGSGLKYKKCCL
jgi:hypothetical protein